MDESEKNRGRTVFARRQQQQQQQQQQQPGSTPQAESTHKKRQRAARRMGDFMAGVAAGLSARKNAASAAVLPTHLDFSIRDRTDVSAKRRFQVKVPCRLMAILAVVFLVFPGLVFFHREIHIHDGNYEYHFKSEQYVNVDTEEVWESFRLANTKDDPVPAHGVAAEHSDDQTPEMDAEQSRLGPNPPPVEKSAVVVVAAAKNTTEHLPASAEGDGHANAHAHDEPASENREEDYLPREDGSPPEDGGEREAGVEASKEDQSPRGYESSPVLDTEPSDEAHPDAPSLTTSLTTKVLTVPQQNVLAEPSDAAQGIHYKNTTQTQTQANTTTTNNRFRV